MLFQAVVKFLSRLVEIKKLVKEGKVHCTIRSLKSIVLQEQYEYFRILLKWLRFFIHPVYYKGLLT